MVIILAENKGDHGKVIGAKSVEIFVLELINTSFVKVKTALFKAIGYKVLIVGEIVYPEKESYRFAVAKRVGVATKEIHSKLGRSFFLGDDFVVRRFIKDILGSVKGSSYRVELHPNTIRPVKAQVHKEAITTSVV